VRSRRACHPEPVTDDAERVEFDGLEIERRHLDGPGTTLDELLTLLEVELVAGHGRPQPRPLPARGWHVLHRDASGITTLGAPVAGSDGPWCTGTVMPTGDGPRWFPSPLLHRPRPLLAERRRGLALAWPRIVLARPHLGHLAIDLRNERDDAWLPHAETLHVSASFSDDAAPGRGAFFAYVAGSSGAVPLDAGDYARLPVNLQQADWPAEPGRFWVTAYLTDLALTSEPLAVDVTSGDLAVREASSHPRPSAPPPPAE